MIHINLFNKLIIPDKLNEVVFYFYLKEPNDLNSCKKQIISDLDSNNICTKNYNYKITIKEANKTPIKELIAKVKQEIEECTELNFLCTNLLGNNNYFTRNYEYRGGEISEDNK